MAQRFSAYLKRPKSRESFRQVQDQVALEIELPQRTQLLDVAPQSAQPAALEREHQQVAQRDLYRRERSRDEGEHRLLSFATVAPIPSIKAGHTARSVGRLSVVHPAAAAGRSIAEFRRGRAMRCSSRENIYIYRLLWFVSHRTKEVYFSAFRILRSKRFASSPKHLHKSIDGGLDMLNHGAHLHFAV